jgi:hypothetical protein
MNGWKFLKQLVKNLEVYLRSLSLRVGKEGALEPFALTEAATTTVVSALPEVETQVTEPDLKINEPVEEDINEEVPLVEVSQKPPLHFQLRMRFRQQSLKRSEPRHLYLHYLLKNPLQLSMNLSLSKKLLRLKLIRSQKKGEHP